MKEVVRTVEREIVNEVLGQVPCKVVKKAIRVL